MSGAQIAWATCLIVALGLLPVGALRMLVYKTGEIDHSPTHRFVAWLALVLGGMALLALIALTVWALARGQRPV